ncbi:lytic transglycosylase domain-containing protein [Salmonella enterica]|nr:lytic transglycosylase domain-containing protein [Salmonella enterica]
MALAEFAVLAAMCAPAIHPTTLSAVVTQESRGNIYAIGINGDYKLPRQPRTLEEAIVTAEQLKKDGHNFDAGLGQINVKNLEWLGMSIADLFDPCKNLKGAQTVLADCYERAVPQYGEGQAALQAALSCYNTGNFKRGFANGYVQKVASHVGVRVPALAPVDGKPQEPVQLRAVAKGEAVQAPPAKTREGLDDAFTHKTSGVRDAFSAADAFSSNEEQEVTAAASVDQN